MLILFYVDLNRPRTSPVYLLKLFFVDQKGLLHDNLVLFYLDGNLDWKFMLEFDEISRFCMICCRCYSSSQCELELLIRRVKVSTMPDERVIDLCCTFCFWANLIANPYVSIFDFFLNSYYFDIDLRSWKPRMITPTDRSYWSLLLCKLRGQQKLTNWIANVSRNQNQIGLLVLLACLDHTSLSRCF